MLRFLGMVLLTRHRGVSGSGYVLVLGCPMCKTHVEASTLGGFNQPLTLNPKPETLNPISPINPKTLNPKPYKP